MPVVQCSTCSCSVLRAGGGALRRQDGAAAAQFAYAPVSQSTCHGVDSDNTLMMRAAVVSVTCHLTACQCSLHSILRHFTATRRLPRTHAHPRARHRPSSLKSRHTAWRLQLRACCQRREQSGLQASGQILSTSQTNLSLARARSGQYSRIAGAPGGATQLRAPRRFQHVRDGMLPCRGGSPRRHGAATIWWCWK